jgi:hypothetical protein
MPVRTLLLATLAATAAYGQSVVSARSGLINFAEGEVFLSDQPVEQKAGKFPEIREGAELRTEAGRAEVLLTPGMLLRVGPDSSITMRSASLIDTRVEFRRGSAVIEVSEDPDGTKARILYRDYEIRFPKKGTFRIDSMPREFRVYEGEVDISYLGEKCTLTKDQKVSLYGGLLANTLHRSITDGLDEWSLRRDAQLAADNPPPGDLNGGAYDPTFAITPNAFYGLGSYVSPISPYSPSYLSGYGTYGYGAYGYGSGLYGYPYVPSPIFIYGGIRGTGTNPGRPVIYGPPVRIPIRTPVMGVPRAMFPTPNHPATPLRPAMVGHPAPAPSRPAVVGHPAPSRPAAVGRSK